MSLVLIVPAHVAAQTLLVDEDGQLFVMYEVGQVLGEEKEKVEKKEEKQEVRREEKKEEKKEDKKEEKREEKQGEQTIETRTGTTRRKIEIRNGQFQEEFKDAAGERKIKMENGKLEIRVKTNTAEKESEREPEDDATPSAVVERIRIRQTDDIEMTPASGSGVDIRRGRVTAHTQLPLSVGADNELIVTTPAGSKMVSVLPDTAIANLVRRGIVLSSESAGTKDNVELKQENGNLEYSVQGVKEMKFLGFFPVSAPVQANVSAETGTVTQITQPFYLNVFGFLFR